MSWDYWGIKPGGASNVLQVISSHLDNEWGAFLPAMAKPTLRGRVRTTSCRGKAGRRKCVKVMGFGEGEEYAC